MSDECCMLSAGYYKQNMSEVRVFLLHMACKKIKPQVGDWFLSVLNYFPVLSAECGGPSAEW